MINQVQQYRLSVEDASDAVIGGLVYSDNGSDEVIGFVSNTDSRSYIEFTLMNPVDTCKLPSTIYNVIPRVNYQATFEHCVPFMDDAHLEYWCKDE